MKTFLIVIALVALGFLTISFDGDKIRIGLPCIHVYLDKPRESTK